MLKRKIEAQIDSWIKTGKTALLITGVRQSGKTYIIKNCLKRAKVRYVYIDLLHEVELRKILEETNNLEELYIKLRTHIRTPLKKGMVIFFDEVQTYKNIVTKIKALVDDGTFRYVLSGSLLGVFLRGVDSAPVGYMDTYQMYPLDFEEFLRNYNENEDVVDYLRGFYKDRKPIPDTIHNKMQFIFNLYLIVGGMPQAVDEFLRSGDLDEVSRIHAQIQKMFDMDFTQYGSDSEKIYLSRIYHLIPSELDKRNKRFTFTEVNKADDEKTGDDSAANKKVRKVDRYTKLDKEFLWLWRAGVALPAFNSPIEPSLRKDSKTTLFKLFMCDVGLLTTEYGKGAKDRILNNAKEINCGAVYENYVAQELTAHGYSVFYHSSAKNGELDFLVEHDRTILPIEVKSGKDYNDHAALSKVMSSKNYDIDEAYVLANCNIRQEGNIIYMPVYMLMFLTEEIVLGKVDLNKYRITEFPEE
ncbi:MAG: AAA family ATPase [Clostridia bacterium]|nr:AAA family ATPase [Clostridia bacterium]